MVLEARLGFPTPTGAAVTAAALAQSGGGAGQQRAWGSAGLGAWPGSAGPLGGGGGGSGGGGSSWGLGGAGAGGIGGWGSGGGGSLLGGGGGLSGAAAPAAGSLLDRLQRLEARADVAVAAASKSEVGVADHVMNV